MSFESLRSNRVMVGLTTGLTAATLAACGGNSPEQSDPIKIDIEMPKGSKDMGGISLTGFSGKVPFLEYSRNFLVERSQLDLADCGTIELNGKTQEVGETRTAVKNLDALLVSCNFGIEGVNDFDGLSKQIEKNIDIVYIDPNV